MILKKVYIPVVKHTRNFLFFLNKKITTKFHKNCETYFSFFFKNEKLSQYRENSKAIFSIVGLRIEKVTLFQFSNSVFLFIRETLFL